MQLSLLSDEISSLNRNQVIKKIEEIIYLKDQSTTKLEQEWSKYRSENYSKNVSMIQSLLSVIDNDLRQAELRVLDTEIRSKRVGDASTVSKIEKYRQISLNIIKDLGMKPEVEAFVMKLAGNEELVLDDVTEEIMKWLLSHNVSKKLSFLYSNR